MNWQPIETAVKDSRARLVYCPEYQNIFCACWHHYEFEPELDGWRIFGSSSRLPNMDDPPTHWMPLPEPPEAH